MYCGILYQAVSGQREFGRGSSAAVATMPWFILTKGEEAKQEILQPAELNGFYLKAIHPLTGIVLSEEPDRSSVAGILRQNTPVWNRGFLQCYLQEKFIVHDLQELYEALISQFPEHVEYLGRVQKERMRLTHDPNGLTEPEIKSAAEAVKKPMSIEDLIKISFEDKFARVKKMHPWIKF